MSRTPSLIKNICSCKPNLVTSPLLLRFDSSRPNFLKTDWSAGRMGYILMHPDDSPDSLAAITHMAVTGKCLFDISLDGPRLRPVLFGSRANLSYERNYHSFVGEVACGRWITAAYRKYLLSALFYRICDCSSVKEVLEYDGSIHQLKRWTQELMVYEFVCLHRPNKMMKDVDGVCRYIDPLIRRYLFDAAAMRSDDIALRIFAYNFDVFLNVLTLVMFHIMMVSLIPSLSLLFPLFQYFIITQFGSHLTCIHSSQENLLPHFRDL